MPDLSLSGDIPALSLEGQWNGLTVTDLPLRIAEKIVGPIPDGLELDHTCVTPMCVFPAHTEPVTHAVNQRRIAERQLACRREGHDWTNPENVRTRPNGRRYCAECDRISLRARYAARKAAA